MATYELRPLAVGEILDGAFAIYRSHFGTLLTIAAVCQGPGAALSLYVTLGGGFMLHVWTFVTAVLLGALGGLLAAGATLHVISEAYLGREPELGTALLFAVGKMWPLFVAGLARGLVVMLWGILLVVPGIIALCGYAVTSQAVVLENLQSPMDALGRSWALTRGFKGKAFSLGLVVILLVNLPSFGVVALTRGNLAVAQILSALISLTLTPIFACTFTLLYYDLRVRKEAFDLEVLGRHLGFGDPAA
jgi:hypothetical protein